MSHKDGEFYTKVGQHATKLTKQQVLILELTYIRTLAENKNLKATIAGVQGSPLYGVFICKKDNSSSPAPLQLKEK